jgi:serine hydrolase
MPTIKKSTAHKKTAKRVAKKTAKKTAKKIMKGASPKKKTAPKKTILFLHSAGPQGPGQGSSGFVGHLKKELGSGFSILAPKMPKPQAPDYGLWKAMLKKILSGLKGDVILIGHSLGGSVLLKYLSEEKVKIRIPALFLAATPFWGEKGWEYDVFRLQDGFAKKLPAIPFIFLYHSRKDEVVEFRHLKRYADELPKALLRPIAGSEHVFDEKGLPELVADLKAI